MIQTFISHEEVGATGALKKAAMLRDTMGYKVLSIEHTMVPEPGSLSTPHAKNWLKKERGYAIVVDTDGYSSKDDRSLPEIVEH